MKHGEINLPRATTRRAARAGIPMDLLKELTEIVTKKTVSTTVDQYLVIVAYTLWKKTKFGDKKLIMTLNQIRDMANKIETQELTIPQMKKEMEDTLNIALVGEDKENESTNDGKQA